MSGAAAGYSGTPLPKKLGLKPGMAVRFVGLPEGLRWLENAIEPQLSTARAQSPLSLEGRGAGGEGARGGDGAKSSDGLQNENDTASRAPPTDTGAFTLIPDPSPLEGEGRITSSSETASLDLLHAFHTVASELRQALPTYRAAIAANGMIWISWPKRASKVPTDITEDVIRAEAIRIGLVDVKVCAVDEVWSGLKLVIPLALRPAT